MTFAATLALTHLHGPLAPDVAVMLAPLDAASDDAKAWVARAFRFMEQARFRPSDFSLGLAAHFASIATSLPSAWGGMVLPMTNAGRHIRLDDYVRAQTWRPLVPGTDVLDVGCGFPPVTTVETAERLPELAHVTGIDPMLGHYLVYDDAGNIACLSADGGVLYFRPEGAVDVDRWDALYADLEAARRHFTQLFTWLKPGLPPGDGYAEHADLGGRIVRNAPEQYNSRRVRFFEAGIGSEGVVPSDVIRCMNVLMYFDAERRAASMRWLAAHLPDGGILLAGQDAPSYGHHRYLVWRREGDALVPVEFAMSPDSWRGFLSIDWHALHDDDEEGPLRAAVLARLWADEPFRAGFDATFDRALEAQHYHARRADGVLGGPPPGLVADQIVTIHQAIEADLDAAGCVDRAVEVLQRAGCRAWRNPVGHLSVDPREWGVQPVPVVVEA